MKEIFLQYIWQNQLFDKEHLRTVNGQKLQIIRPGYLNHESGPDFLQAQIKLDDLVWFGAIEIHVDARDWQRHQHQQDPAYDNVILHVAWYDESPQLRPDGTILPLLLLQHRVDQQILVQYENLLKKAKSGKQLACAHSLHLVPGIYKSSALERAAASRLMRKADEIYDMYLQHGKDWGQTALQCLSRGFGFKVNASAFSTLGAKVSYHSLQKESSSFATILALLAGVSGLFSHQEVFSEDLQARVKHIMNKYGLDHHSMQAHEFRRAPVRPANAPHVRLIQLAAFLYLKPHLIDFLLLADDPEAYFSAFEQANSLVTKNQTYYKKVSKMGKSSMESIIINSVVPFQFAYAKHNANESLEQKAISLWQKMHAEQNRYTRLYMSHGFEISSSLESQGAIEQHRFFCKEGRCLQCPVGNYIMKNHQIVVI